MGESAALKTENVEVTHSTEDQANGPQNTLDKAIQELSGVEAEAPAPAPAPVAAQQPVVEPTTDASAQIWDIPVDVSIVMGSAELTVARLMKLENGDVVELDRRVGEPLDIAVNGRNIAKGMIVMKENDESQFAIQITELVGR